LPNDTSSIALSPQWAGRQNLRGHQLWVWKATFRRLRRDLAGAEASIQGAKEEAAEAVERLWSAKIIYELKRQDSGPDSDTS
jgi:hypothetical protein